MKGGYAGKMLFVDLTSRSIKIETLTEEIATAFIGGYGIGARVLYDMIQPGADPLGSGNVIGFVTGPLNGTGAFFGGRYAVVSKSPVTGGWNDANSGGHFGPELKKAGFDAVFVSGKADTPVYLWINDGQAEIRDAQALWGQDCTEVLASLKKETGEDKLRAAVIGPAGEHLSLMACVINDRHRAAGRGGSGAVMGSKNLKAVAVRGTQKVPVADRKALNAVNKEISTALKTGPNAEHVQMYGSLGTGNHTHLSALNGDSPVKNWGGVGVRDISEENAAKLSSSATDKYNTGKYACSACPLACGAEYEVNEGPWPLKDTHRPEYETAGAFGPLCLNYDAAAIIKCNDICNRAGLDTISTGATVAWAMECYENGLITKEDTDGVELTWGNAEAIVTITEAIAGNTGFGKILALGSQQASQKLGKGEEYLVTASGIELPMHDPKLAPGYARTYQYDPTPGRHMKGGPGVLQAEDPNPAKYNYSESQAMDLYLCSVFDIFQTGGACMFAGMFAIESIPKALAAVTGWTVDQAFMASVMMRVTNMRHAFNLREGMRPADFNIPSRAVGEPPQEVGPHEGRTIDHKMLAKNFFEGMQWDPETGKPSREILQQLGGLDDVANDLYG